MESLKHLLPQAYSRHQLNQIAQAAYITQEAEQALKAYLDLVPGKVKVKWFKRGVLGVACETGLVAETLNYQINSILPTLNERVKPAVISRISFLSWTSWD